MLAVARDTKAAFEWSDHVEYAVAAGLPPDVIEALKARGIRDGAFPEPFAAAAQVLQATLGWQSIPVDVQTAAISCYGLKGFIEIVVLSGFYQMFSAINQGFDIS